MKLLQHFKELTVNPKNAKELKGLILQLAIQGKLTGKWREENKNIEPASELIKRIEKKNDLLIKEKKIKKEKPLPRISKEEIPFGLTKTWVWTRLGDIGTTNVGLTYKPAHINDDGVPVLRSSNIQEGELCLKDLVRVNTDYREKDIIKEGDLLICARNGSRRLVGKCTIIEQIDEIMVFGAFMAIFRSDFNPYLQLFIQSPQYRSKLDGVETTTINQITQGNLKETMVPLPPLEEQKEIVKVVETLFKEVAQLEQLTVERIGLKEDFVTSALNQLTTNNANQEWTFLQDHFKNFFNETTNIKKLRETVLQLAVQGKLTADWRTNNPDTEDASVLLKRIQEEKAQLIADKKIKKEKALPKITKDDIPYELPEYWVWCRMSSALKFIDYRGKTPNKITKGVRLLTAKNVRPGYLKINPEEFMSEEEYSNWMTRGFPEKGDILFTTEAPLGNVCQLELDEKVGLAQRIITLQPYVSDLNKRYLMYCFMSEPFQKLILDKATGMTAQGIKASKLKLIPFPLPPLEEQKAIVEEVNALMGLCDSLEQEVQQSQEQSEMLMQSCLREVFEN
ncbi:restriction endonuclease subunit S [uncultured Polaribacter sp.]|uniref:restriction endonuclease subunit S n=1 Tax=uncultured Polaribacter sp. TaxID=174711 RepID=UPI0030DC70CC|tara:strand:+ start:1342 stop:3039 length:1698 start_codon:yes stop_codon:yes gene_type:complete